MSRIITDNDMSFHQVKARLEEIDRLRAKVEELQTALRRLMGFNPRRVGKYDCFGNYYTIPNGEALLKVLDQCDVALGDKEE